MENDDVLLKSHVKGYTKKDGTYVKPHQRAGEAAEHVPHYHPRTNDSGKQVIIHHPHHASAPSTWHHRDAVATFVPDGDVPLSINGVKLMRWKDHPRTPEGWDYVDGVKDDLEEPPFKHDPKLHASSGVIIEEPDGRVWLIHPTNSFGGYEASFPKGTAEAELSLQANAIKEAFEESGLKVEITGFIGDFTRTTSVCRMYRARRVGGTPVSMGWESQAVSLVPKALLYEHLNGAADHPIAEAIGAGPAPKLPEPKDKPGWPKGWFDKKDQ